MGSCAHVGNDTAARPCAGFPAWPAGPLGVGVSHGADVTAQPPTDAAAVDADQLGRVAAGDRDALARLYERHRVGLGGFLTRMLGDPATAEEALQDTLLAVWRGAGAFEHRSTVRTWLFGIARRQAYTRLRRHTPVVTELPTDAALADPSPTPEHVAVARAEVTRLMGLIGRLAPVHREALLLFFVDDLGYAEMAEVLDVPVGTVKSRLSNARRALAVLLQTTGDQA